MENYNGGDGNSRWNSMAGSSEATIKIRLRTMDAQTHTLIVYKHVPILELKAQISMVTGVLPEQQLLIHQGKLVEDRERLSAYNVEDGHILHMVVRQAQWNHLSPENSPASTGSSSTGTQVNSDELDGYLRPEQIQEIMLSVRQIMSTVMGAAEFGGSSHERINHINHLLNEIASSGPGVCISVQGLRPRMGQPLFPRQGARFAQNASGSSFPTALQIQISRGSLAPRTVSANQVAPADVQSALERIYSNSTREFGFHHQLDARNLRTPLSRESEMPLLPAREYINSVAAGGFGFYGQPGARIFGTPFPRESEVPLQPVREHINSMEAGQFGFFGPRSARNLGAPFSRYSQVPLQPALMHITSTSTNEFGYLHQSGERHSGTPFSRESEVLMRPTFYTIPSSYSSDESTDMLYGPPTSENGCTLEQLLGVNDYEAPFIDEGPELAVTETADTATNIRPTAQSFWNELIGPSNSDRQGFRYQDVLAAGTSAPTGET